MSSFWHIWNFFNLDIPLKILQLIFSSKDVLVTLKNLTNNKEAYLIRSKEISSSQNTTMRFVHSCLTPWNLYLPKQLFLFQFFFLLERKVYKNYFEAFCEFWLLPIERMLIIHWNATRKFIIEMWEQIFSCWYIRLLSTILY